MVGLRKGLRKGRGGDGAGVGRAGGCLQLMRVQEMAASLTVRHVAGGHTEGAGALGGSQRQVLGLLGLLLAVVEFP